LSFRQGGLGRIKKRDVILGQAFLSDGFLQLIPAELV
jgi:hypothetical protein